MFTLITGTNRPQSNSLAIVQHYSHLLQERPLEHTLLDLAQLPADFTTNALYDRLGQHQAFNELSQVISEGSKFVLVVPEYNGSYPGVLKAFIDGLNYKTSFRFKKVGLIGLSSGSGGCGIGMSHLTDVFHYLGAEVLSYKPRLPFIEKYLSMDGKLEHAQYEKMLQEHVERMLLF